MLRADFAWIKSYRYAPGPPLEIPVVAFAGLDDGEVPPPTCSAGPGTPAPDSACAPCAAATSSSRTRPRTSPG
nr:hypothetical protein GCM10020093_013400 [Planobispora longispora]